MPPDPSPAEPRTSWTAAELVGADFPPPRWAVPGLVAEGVSLLAGPPKVGKSWLSLGIALSVAMGMPVLGRIDVEPGPVLYLALEDTPRRLKTRITKMLADAPAPNRLTLATACPTLTDGGDTRIAEWLDRNPAARLVIIDVFAKMRGRTDGGTSAYEADYAAMGRVKTLADAYGIAVLVVHHVRKLGSDDFLSEVSGTNGIAGAADAVLVLKRPRGTADGVLHITGRDVDEAEYPLKFDPGSGTWLMLDGPADDYTLSDTRAAILRHLRNHPGHTPKDTAEATGLSHDLVKKTCARMADDGQLSAHPGGRYTTPGTPLPVPAVPEPAFPLVNTPTEEHLSPPPHTCPPADLLEAA